MYPRNRLKISTLALSGLIVASLVQGRVAFADTLSDLLVIVNPDGRSYTAQHTLSSDGDLLLLELPTGRTTQHVSFSGPERHTFEVAHRENPDRLAVWSGSAVIRYQHQFGAGLVKLSPTAHTLKAYDEHLNATADVPSRLQTTISWLLPENATLLSFQDRAVTDDAGAGRWQRNGNTLMYQQQGGTLAALSIEFRIEQADEEPASSCVPGFSNSDHCSRDVDGDQVPDHRDACLPTPADRDSLPKRLDFHQRGEGLDVMGCDNHSLIVLDGVRFQSGQSYLDVAAREVLDRTALALQQIPEQRFELGAHTDNAGRVSHNQRLSENRADAVRHYLMLRGVGPNQLRSQGFGESLPAYDNRQAAGRRANRRIELKRLN